MTAPLRRFNGGSFLNYNEDVSSMTMAIFFAVAVLAYAAFLYISPSAEHLARN